MGRALASAGESYARECVLPRITLETGAANVRAQSFYQALGYAEEEVRLSKLVSADDRAVSAVSGSLPPGSAGCSMAGVRRRSCVPAEW
ncbi:GNAT family N-acetyltransferase [Nonomuraea sp. NPDC003804]|uniref:GNAT family N-acetyltransferase n=1 Tax=Nonomuraea sp. NPDC003804 TaxID=3154547 RepID=UPI0033AE5107